MTAARIVGLEFRNYLFDEFDPTRFDPLHADESASKPVALWRQRMNAPIKQPPALRSLQKIAFTPN